jgi:hypothetical protein
MKLNKHLLLLTIGAIGIAMMIYGVLHSYSQSTSTGHPIAVSTTTPPGEIPDIIHVTPGVPPMQPH